MRLFIFKQWTFAWRRPFTSPYTKRVLYYRYCFGPIEFRVKA